MSKNVKKTLKIKKSKTEKTKAQEKSKTDNWADGCDVQIPAPINVGVLETEPQSPQHSPAAEGLSPGNADFYPESPAYCPESPLSPTYAPPKSPEEGGSQKHAPANNRNRREVDPHAQEIGAAFMKECGDLARKLKSRKLVSDLWQLWKRGTGGYYNDKTEFGVVLFAMAHGLKFLRVKHNGQFMSWNRFRDNEGNRVEPESRDNRHGGPSSGRNNRRPPSHGRREGYGRRDRSHGRSDRSHGSHDDYDRRDRSHGSHDDYDRRDRSHGSHDDYDRRDRSRGRREDYERREDRSHGRYDGRRNRSDEHQEGRGKYNRYEHRY